VPTVCRWIAEGYDLFWEAGPRPQKWHCTGNNSSAVPGHAECPAAFVEFLDNVMPELVAMGAVLPWSEARRRPRVGSKLTMIHPLGVVPKSTPLEGVPLPVRYTAAQPRDVQAE
jgi:hypothetical protein